jgi:hypothetical protein
MGLGTVLFPTVFNDNCLMTMPMISFRAGKIDKKCKLLSEFLAVTLRALC